MTDRLTQAMAQAKRHGRRLALVYLDIDGFKTINDTHGRAMGDRLLIAMAHRMRASLRDIDTLARLGVACFPRTDELDAD
jgi:diguanylate cyclase (GGDEF)-like protein